MLCVTERLRDQMTRGELGWGDSEKGGRSGGSPGHTLCPNSWAYWRLYSCEKAFLE